MDRCAVLSGQFANGIPQAGHPQADFGRAGVGQLPLANSKELLPHTPNETGTGTCADSDAAVTLPFEAFTPNPGAQNAFVQNTRTSDAHD